MRLAPVVHSVPKSDGRSAATLPDSDSCPIAEVARVIGRSMLACPSAMSRDTDPVVTTPPRKARESKSLPLTAPRTLSVAWPAGSVKGDPLTSRSARATVASDRARLAGSAPIAPTSIGPVAGTTPVTPVSVDVRVRVRS